MSDASIPAWKRAGSKQAKNAAAQTKTTYDPLKEGSKRASEGSSKPAKPAKKPKLAKADRPAPTHELDQLAYLRQYAEDRSAWKFSKQKQNWLSKHMFSDVISENYEHPSIQYIEGLQGSSRNWVLEDSMSVVNRWNTFMREDINEVKNEGDENLIEETKSTPNDDKSENPDKNVSADTNEESSDGKKNKKNKNKPKAKTEEPPKVPTKQMVLRAKNLIEVLGQECPPSEIIDKPVEDETDAKEKAAKSP